MLDIDISSKFIKTFGKIINFINVDFYKKLPVNMFPEIYSIQILQKGSPILKKLKSVFLKVSTFREFPGFSFVQNYKPTL
ncbi:unnamed protein product [Parnassius mnemosyne]|uniref:Uncharacterized protein n=1 Tax=Parnassius mnemosyne TaxID=213953 RepID=A0AAV1KC23_9NEOP